MTGNSQDVTMTGNNMEVTQIVNDLYCFNIILYLLLMDNQSHHHEYIITKRMQNANLSHFVYLHGLV